MTEPDAWLSYNGAGGPGLVPYLIKSDAENHTIDTRDDGYPKPLYTPETIEEVIQIYIDERYPEASPIDNDVVTTLKALKNEFSEDKAGTTERDKKLG